MAKNRKKSVLSIFALCPRSRLAEIVCIRTVGSVASETAVHYLCVVMQSVLIGILFVAAAFYLARMVFRSFRAKNECATGCGKCATSNTSQKLSETLK